MCSSGVLQAFTTMGTSAFHDSCPAETPRSHPNSRRSIRYTVVRLATQRTTRLEFDAWLELSIWLGRLWATSTAHWLMRILDRPTARATKRKATGHETRHETFTYWGSNDVWKFSEFVSWARSHRSRLRCRRHPSRLNCD